MLVDGDAEAPAAAATSTLVITELNVSGMCCNSEVELIHAKLGALAAPRVQRWLTDYRPLQHTLLPYVATAPGAAALESLLNASCTQFPNYCEEVEGLAHGSGAPGSSSACGPGGGQPLAMPLLRGV